MSLHNNESLTETRQQCSTRRARYSPVSFAPIHPRFDLLGWLFIQPSRAAYSEKVLAVHNGVRARSLNLNGREFLLLNSVGISQWKGLQRLGTSTAGGSGRTNSCLHVFCTRARRSDGRVYIGRPGVWWCRPRNFSMNEIYSPRGPCIVIVTELSSGSSLGSLDGMLCGFLRALRGVAGRVRAAFLFSHSVRTHLPARGCRIVDLGDNGGSSGGRQGAANLSQGRVGDLTRLGRAVFRMLIRTAWNQSGQSTGSPGERGTSKANLHNRRGPHKSHAYARAKQLQWPPKWFRPGREFFCERRCPS